MRLDLLSEGGGAGGSTLASISSMSKDKFTSNPKRDNVRQLISDYLFNCDRILTLPSNKWTFEHLMIGNGYGGEFIGVEEDDNITSDLVANMPRGSGSVVSSAIGDIYKRFYLSDSAAAFSTSFNKFVNYYKNGTSNLHNQFARFDGAWLDFQSILNDELVEALKWFPYICDLSSPVKLVITFSQRMNQYYSMKFKSVGDGNAMSGMIASTLGALDDSGLVHSSLVEIEPFTSNKQAMVVLFIELKPRVLDDINVLGGSPDCLRDFIIKYGAKAVLNKTRPGNYTQSDVQNYVRYLKLGSGRHALKDSVNSRYGVRLTGLEKQSTFNAKVKDFIELWNKDIPMQEIIDTLFNKYGRDRHGTGKRDTSAYRLRDTLVSRGVIAKRPSMEERHAAICNDYTSGMKIKELAEKYNMRKHSILALLDRLGVRPKRKVRPMRRFSSNEASEIVRSYATVGSDVTRDKYSLTQFQLYYLLRREKYEPAAGEWPKPVLGNN